MSKVNTVNTFRDLAKTNQANIAQINSIGEKKEEAFTISTVAGSGTNTSKGIRRVVRQNNTEQGQLTNTGNTFDLAIEGQGYFLVRNANGQGNETFLSREASARIDKVGNLTNAAGYTLLGRRVGSSVDEFINLANIKGDPKASTSISVAMNLNASTEEITGAGPLFRINRQAKNSQTARRDVKDILIPEQVTNGKLSLGDRFTFTSTPPGVAREVEYGGIAIGRAPTSTEPLFGTARNSTDQIVGTQAGQIAGDTTFTIKTGGASGREYVFVAKEGSANTSNKEFNSIQSLAEAITKVGPLVARVVDGSIYIASENPNDEMIFSSSGAVNIETTLGLANIPAAPTSPVTISRFNSMFTLNRLMNSEEGLYGQKAKLDLSAGTIKISSASAENNFNITGSSLGKTPIKTALLGDGTARGRSTVRIAAPGNNLRIGDYVRLEGTSGAVGGLLGDGIYMVTKRTDNEFAVALVDNPVLANNPSNIPVAAVQTNVAPASGMTWQKIMGKVENESAGLLVSTVAPQAGGQIRIPTAAGHGIVANDVVYISGNVGNFQVGGRDIELPEGYYKVTAVDQAGGNNIEVTPAANNAAAGFAAPAATDSLTFRKIGTVGAGAAFNGGNATFSPVVMEAVTNGDDFVRVYLPNSSYNAGDKVKFSNFTANAFDGFQINPDMFYEVKARTANYIDVLFLDNAGAPHVVANQGAVVGYDYYAGANDVNIGGTIEVDNITRTLEFFGLGGDAQTKQTYEKTYDATDFEKSLSSGLLNADNEIVEQIVTAYDSLGDQYELKMVFGKLTANRWAVEIAGVRDPVTQTFDYDNAAIDGQITRGFITFNADGQIANIEGINNTISIQRKNGSALTNLTFDFENQDGDVKNVSFTQFDKVTDLELLQDNGHAASTIDRYQVDSNGTLFGISDESGEVIELWKIMLGTVANPNGLQAESGGNYSVTGASGQLIKKTPGAPGAGLVRSNTLEQSTTDASEEVTSLKLNSVAQSAAVAVVQTDIETEKNTISSLSRA